MKEVVEKIEAVIFGFDGIIFNTDIYHFLSWKKSLQLIGINMDPIFQFELNGINRENSLDKVLEIFEIEIDVSVKKEILIEKNRIYKALTKELSKKDVLPGIIDLLKHLNKLGIKTALATSSRNASEIMKRTRMDEYFTFIPKASVVKGHDELCIDVYVEISTELQIPQFKIASIESSQIGIDSASDMFIRTIAINLNNNLKNAMFNFKTTRELTPEIFDKIMTDI